MCAEKITTSDIKSAEKLLGITYSKSEREQMVQNLEGQILSAKLRRGIKLDNTTPMASKFDPRLPGFQMPSRSGIKLQRKDTKLPKNKDYYIHDYRFILRVKIPIPLSNCKSIRCT